MSTRRADGPWSIYMLRCGDGSLYTGIATDVKRRVLEHRAAAKGARYLRGRGPLQLVLQHELGNRSLASRAEYRIKRLSRLEKEALIAAPERIDAILAAGVRQPADRSGKKSACR